MGKMTLQTFENWKIGWRPFQFSCLVKSYPSAFGMFSQFDAWKILTVCKVRNKPDGSEGVSMHGWGQWVQNIDFKMEFLPQFSAQGMLWILFIFHLTPRKFPVTSKGFMRWS